MGDLGRFHIFNPCRKTSPTMVKLGLEERWAILALETIQTASYSTLINGEPCDFISHTHGIKQGDPLFPYLFLICTEGLSSLLQKAEDNR